MGHVYGQDGDDSNTTKLNLGFSDEEGIWKVVIEGVLAADARVSGDITLDVMKLFDVDSDFSFKVGLLANDEQTGLRAYANKSGNNWDRIRTAAPGLWTSLQFGWADMVALNIAGSPRAKGVADGPEVGSNKVTGWSDMTAGDVVISALVTPLDGLKVSADWAYNGEDKSISKASNKGVVGGALDVNVGKMLDLGFNIGVSASERYEYESGYNVVAATIYGGVDVVDGFVEYALRTEEGQTTEHYLVAQANLNFLADFPMNVYFGANNLVDFGNTFFVGGNVGYKLKGVSFNIGVEYSCKDSSFGYDNSGLVIVPSVGVSF